MSNNYLTTASILEKTMQHVAPLPSQAGYARALAAIFSMHIHRNELMDDGFAADELPAPSAIVVAPTGQGKTYLLRKMAECLDLNVITIDCSTLSAEGWKGISFSQHLASACKDAKDEQSFSQSILFFDEIDKMKLWGTPYDQGSAMPNILQLFNGGTVSVEIDKCTRNIDIRRFTILLGGAFVGLEDIVEERVCPKPAIGFSNQGTNEKLSKGELMQRATTDDLAKFGLMPELLGRIGTVLTIPPLVVEDYRQLLNAEAGSLRRKFNNYLQNLYGVEFEIAPRGIETIAHKCMDSNIGARAVNPLVNDMMRDAIAAVEAEKTICKVLLDADEDGCCIRYEHGPRTYAYRSPVRQQELKDHIIQAVTVQALVTKLCRLHRLAGGELRALNQMEPFLQCALTFLHCQCRPKEFSFDSLEKLARATDRDGGKAPFDIVLDDTKTVLSKELRTAYDRAYSPWMKKNLIAAFQLIMDYIQSEHGPCRVLFEVPRKRPTTE